MNCNEPRINELPRFRFGVRGLAVAFQNAMRLSNAGPAVLESGGKPPHSKTLRSNKTLAFRHRPRRSGAVLIWCAFLLPVLVGMVGLVIDGGLMMASYREAQNAADAAALAGAYDLIRGTSNATAVTDATTIVTGASYNNLPTATVTVNIPPVSGPYKGSTPYYVQAVVTCPFTAHFIQVLPGVSGSQSVTAQAVAQIGFTSGGAGVLALSPSGTGLSVGGSALLAIPGTIQVNSSTTTSVNDAVKMTGTTKIQALTVNIAGGENLAGSASITNVGGIGPNPVVLGAPSVPDLFSFLPTPTTANGVVNTVQSASKLSVGSGTLTLNPGIYIGGIDIHGSTHVTLNPGIYVLEGGGMNIAGSAVISDGGKGVMFYNTGADYNPTTGAPDTSDPIDPFNQSFPAADPAANFGPISLAGSAQITISPLSTAGNPFNGVVYYQRRANTQAVGITGSTTDATTGTIYAKWAALNLAGTMSSSAQFVVNTVGVTGSGTITINYIGKNLGKAPQVYLVD